MNYRIPLICSLACALGSAWAEPSGVNVIHGAQDESVPSTFSRLITAVTAHPDAEMVRLEFDLGQSDLFASELLLLAGQDEPGGSSQALAVLYPDIGEPYRSVFMRMVEGVKAEAGAEVASYAIGPQFDAAAMADELKGRNIRRVIALGQNGLRAAEQLGRGIGVVAGGMVSASGTEKTGKSVFTLTPDPGLLFERLQKLSPETRRVLVLYDPRHNGWLIRHADRAARQAGLELVAREAADSATAARLHREFLATAESRRDAIWLLQEENSANPSDVLPHLLQAAWVRNVPVFSSSAAHVRQGALFALYPDPVGVGRHLAISALGMMTAGEPSTDGPRPLRDVLTAFNSRTARHLGLRLSAAQRSDFDLVFPEY